MNARRIGLSLAFLMVTAGGLMIYSAFQVWFRQSPESETTATRELKSMHSVREVVWNELPEIKPLQLTERDGSRFEMEAHDGEVMLVSFFFTRCPSVCREQNSHLAQLQEAYLGRELKLLSITCDPEYDTPVRLREYAKTFKADEKQWLFLNGEFEKVQAYSESVFQTALGENTHGTNLMLVDKWGRFRDRFDWQDPMELLRLRATLDGVLSETEPPGKTTIQTRTPQANAPIDAGHSISDTTENKSPSRSTTYDHGDWKSQDWITEFTLTERSGKKFNSSEMEGRVWVGSFFFTTCPSVCVQQNNQISKLLPKLGERDVTFVSLTTNPSHDTPVKLRQYAIKYKAPEDQWLFLTGDELHIRRIASEYFGAGYMTKENHSTKLVLVDKWGKPRGSFSWDKPGDLDAMRVMIDKLLNESEEPPSDNS